METILRDLETNRIYDKFTMHELRALAGARHKLKTGQKLTNFQFFIHIASLYFFDENIPSGVSDIIKVSAKRYTKCWC